MFLLQRCVGVGVWVLRVFFMVCSGSAEAACVCFKAVRLVEHCCGVIFARLLLLFGDRINEGDATSLSLFSQCPPVHLGSLPVFLVGILGLHCLRSHGFLDWRPDSPCICLYVFMFLVASWRIHACIHLVALVIDFRGLVDGAEGILLAGLIDDALHVHLTRLHFSIAPGI